MKVASVNTVRRQLAELTLYKNNPRKNAASSRMLDSVIDEYGYLVPIIIDGSNEIVAGESRYKSLLRQEVEEVDCILADHLTPEQVREFRLIENKLSEIATWDKNKLDAEIAAIEKNLAKYGFEVTVEPVEDIDPEYPFATELREEHNYIVLKFDNSIDWLQALTMFDLQTVQTLSNRKDGSINPKTVHTGIGRVIDGVEAIRRIKESL